MKLSQEQSAARELKVYETATKNGKDPSREIAKDREKRWVEIVQTISVPPAIESWVADMTVSHGPTCDFYSNRNVGWITALLICRYGEAEYFWPEGFTDLDAARAADWLSGKTPSGVEYTS